MLNLKRKTSTHPDDAQEPMTAWDAARARWAKIEGERERLDAERQGITLALSMSLSTSDASRVPEHLRQVAEPYLKKADRDRDGLIADLKRLNQKIEDFTIALPAECETFEAERRRETNRRARDLQPQHQEAVQKIAAAVEALIEGIADERAIRARCGPLPTSAYLPDLSRWLADVPRLAGFFRADLQKLNFKE